MITEVTIIDCETVAVAPLRKATEAPPNWYETKVRARDQEKLLRQTTRAIQMALATIENDLYATRVANASQYLEDALTELTDYQWEGDLDGEDPLEVQCETLIDQLKATVQATCKHENKKCISTSESGSDTCFINYLCLNCELTWTDELLPAEYNRMLAEEYAA